MPPRLLRQIFIALIGAIALVVAVATFAYESVRQQIAAAKWVDHTEQVRLAIAKTVADFQAVASGHRGYLLTGDPSYLEPYAVAAREIPRDIQVLASLTNDNGDQQARLLLLGRVATEKLATIKQTMTPAAPAPAEPLRSDVAQDEHNMDRIRDITDAMTADEERLLEERNARLEQARNATKWAVSLGALVSLLLLGGAMVGIRRQVREASETARLLADSELRFRILADNASDLIRIHDLKGRATYVSPSAERLLGYTPEEMIALPAFSAIHPDDRPGIEAHVLRFSEPGPWSVSVKHRNRRKDGVYRWFETRAHSVVEGGTSVSYHSSARDIDDEVRVAEELERSRELYRTLVRHLPDTAVLLFDHEFRYLLVEGDEVLRILGLTKAACEGKTLHELTTPERAAAILPNYRAALRGEETKVEMVRERRDFEVQCVPVRNGSGAVAGGLVVVRDTTELRETERRLSAHAEELRTMSLVDELTKLYNRRGFLTLGEQQLKVSTRNQSPLSLVFCDLNGMKKINDGLGHEQGDQALIDTAEILRATFRASDILARLGGDEFVALANDAQEENVDAIILRLKKAVAAYNETGARPFRLSISVGVAQFDPKNPLPIETLVKEADSRMYENKRSQNIQRQSLAPKNHRA